MRLRIQTNFLLPHSRRSQHLLETVRLRAQPRRIPNARNLSYASAHPACPASWDETIPRPRPGRLHSLLVLPPRRSRIRQVRFVIPPSPAGSLAAPAPTCAACRAQERSGVQAAMPVVQYRVVRYGVAVSEPARPARRASPRDACPAAAASLRLWRQQGAPPAELKPAHEPGTRSQSLCADSAQAAV